MPWENLLRTGMEPANQIHLQLLATPIQFNSNFISHLWPNGQITGNITLYKTHQITSKRLNLNTLKLHN